MQELKVAIKNSYGIEEFTHDFKFNNVMRDGHIIPHPRTHIVYAQNGVMKSSFARTLYDHALNHPIKDHIYNIEGSCSLKDDGGNELPKDDVFSIPSFEGSGYECDKMSLLVASKSLKDEYDKLLSKYTLALDAFLEMLKTTSGVKRTTKPEEIMPIFCSLFGDSTPVGNFVHVLKVNKIAIDNAPDFLQQVKYVDIDTSQVQAFIKDNKGFLKDFVEKYDEMLEKSSYLRGGFGTSNAQKVADSLDSEKFFVANHKVVLLEHDNESGVDSERIIDDPDELKSIFQTEFDKIFNDPAIKAKFQKALGKLDQSNNAGLKQILIDDNTRPIIGYLNDHTQLKRQLWFAYAKKHLTELEELISLKDSIEDDVKRLIEAAQKERTEWDKTVEVFNGRFASLPFKLEIENKHTMMLEGSTTPSLKFSYTHKQRSPKVLEKSQLIDFLSTGEKKAFYLLNLLFELQVRKMSSTPQFVVLDDVVDSFDYKNKYAFLEYLYELSSEANNLHIVILTHNFDFFRLMQSRFFKDMTRSNSWMAYKTNDSLSLVEAAWFNPFRYIKDCAPRQKREWLCLIPFVRNLVEYSSGKGDNDYKTLTSCLHLNASNPIPISEVVIIYNNRICISGSPFAGSESVYGAIIAEAEVISGETSRPEVNLPNKIVLSIAIRLKAEAYMKSKLSPTQIQAAIDKKGTFTRELYDEYSIAHRQEVSSLEVLGSVNLITPENIHINAFMYEPIIDMGEDELRTLYAKVKVL